MCTNVINVNSMYGIIIIVILPVTSLYIVVVMI
jgi:hypothetical protein